MKRTVITALVLASLTAVAQAPILSMKQEMDLAMAAQVLSIEVNKLESLPGYKEQMAKVRAAQQKLLSMQDQFCISHDGKKYHLEHDNGVWACRETK